MGNPAEDTVRRRLGEYHEYARHIFSLYMAFYSFFITVNYVALGWVAKDLLTATNKPPTYLWIVPALFFFQTLPALIGTWFVWKRLVAYDKSILDAERVLSGPENVASSLPLDLHERVFI